MSRRARRSLPTRQGGLRLLAVLVGLAALLYGHSLCARIEWPEVSPHKRQPNLHPIIVIDPGHGGSPGGVSRNGIKEKDLTLDIALRLEKLIEQNETAQVFLTRRADRSMSLIERREFANRKQCDIFVSIHTNASRLRSRNHVEVHYSSPWSRPLAQAIGEQLSSEFQLELRIEDVAWTTLWDNWAPLGAVLVETMYLTHEDGEKILASEDGKQRIAASVFRALEKTLSGRPQEGEDRTQRATCLLLRIKNRWSSTAISAISVSFFFTVGRTGSLRWGRRRRRCRRRPCRPDRRCRHRGSCPRRRGCRPR